MIRNWLRAAVVVISVAIPSLARAQMAPQPEWPEAVVNEDLKVRIERPDSAWMLLTPETASDLAEEAALGLLHRNRFVAVVLVEEVGDITLDELASGIHETGIEEASGVTEPREGRAFGQEARVIDFKMDVQGSTMSYRQAIVLRSGFSYSLVAWTPGDWTLTSDVMFEKACAAVTFLAGDIVAPEIEVFDFEGVGWRFRDGRLESAVMGWRAVPGPGWQPAMTDEMDAGFELVLFHEQGARSITFTWYPFQGRERAVLEKNLEASLDGMVTEESVAPSVKVRVLGQEVPVRIRSLLEDRSLLVGSAHVTTDEGVISFDAWWEDRDGRGIPEPVRKALESIERMGTEDRSRLREELAAEPHPQAWVMADRVLRNGTYRALTNDWVWRADRGLWRFHRLEGDGLAFEVVEPTLDLYAFFHEYPGEDLDKAHLETAEFVAGEDRSLEPTRSFKFRDVEARRTRVRSDETSMVVEVVTVLVRGVEVSIEINAPAGLLEPGSERDVVPRLLAGLEFRNPPRPASRKEGDVHVDERLGFSFRMGGDAWHPLPIATPGFGQVWGCLPRIVGVFVLEMEDPRTDIGAVVRSTVDAFIKAEGLSLDPDAGVHDTAEVGGLEAQRFRLDGDGACLRVLTVRRPSLQCIVLAMSSGEDPVAEVEALLDGIRWLD